MLKCKIPFFDGLLSISRCFIFFNNYFFLLHGLLLHAKYISSFNHGYPPTPQLSFLSLHQPNSGSISSSSSLKLSKFPKTLPFKSPTTSFSLAESDSPKSFQPNGPIFQSLLQELAVSIHFPFRISIL